MWWSACRSYDHVHCPWTYFNTKDCVSRGRSAGQSVSIFPSTSTQVALYFPFQTAFDRLLFPLTLVSRFLTILCHLRDGSSFIPWQLMGVGSLCNRLPCFCYVSTMPMPPCLRSTLTVWARLVSLAPLPDSISSPMHPPWIHLLPLYFHVLRLVHSLVLRRPIQVEA
jgi:hypothetical protein